MNLNENRAVVFLQKYFLYFIMYSVMGWLYEVFLEVVVYQWGYSDRGVLTGPYCPVYGVGALLMILCFHGIVNWGRKPAEAETEFTFIDGTEKGGTMQGELLSESIRKMPEPFIVRKKLYRTNTIKRCAGIAAVFIGCALLATALELGASYLLEHLTGAWPWQTYADYKYNFQARIALSPSLRFGLGGVIFLYIFQPLFKKIVNRMKRKTLTYVSGTVMILFAADLIWHVIMNLQ